MIRSIWLVALGGALGAVARYLVSLFVSGNTDTVFPLSTFVVNIAGCLLIGLFCGMAECGSISGGGLKLFLTVGFCGGFTTFSTFGNENVALLRSGHVLVSALYAGGSVFFGLLAAYGGLVAARHFW